MRGPAEPQDATRADLLLINKGLALVKSAGWLLIQLAFPIGAFMHFPVLEYASLHRPVMGRGYGLVIA
jgi:hypothetical protein